MKRTRHTPEQIVRNLREADRLLLEVDIRILCGQLIFSSMKQLADGQFNFLGVI